MSSAATIDNQYLSPPQVAELLHVSHGKVLAWITSGDLRAADLATHRGQRPRWRIARTDLDDFLARRAATGPPVPTRRRRHTQESHIIEFYK